MLSTLERKAREVFEHRPSELRIAVNGDLKGALRVNSDQNEIGLAVSDSEPLEFLEIYSEQQQRMMLVNFAASPKSPSPDLNQSLKLSDGRKIDLQVGFVAKGAEIKVTYADPTFHAVRELLEAADEAPGITPAVPSIDRPSSPGNGLLVNRSLFPALSRIRQLIPSWRPLAFAGALIAVLFGALFIADRTTTLSAKAILEEAEIKKLNWQYQPGKILYWEEEERLQNSDKTYISKRWSNNLNGQRQWVSIRYDEEKKIQFGKWVKPDGQVVEYRPNENLFVVNPTNSQIRQSLANLDEERRVTLTRYLQDSERKLTTDQQAGLHTAWFLKHIANQSVETFTEPDGRKELRLRFKSDLADRDPKLNGTELEADYDKESLQRSRYRLTFNKKDGTSTFEEARLLAAREASLEDFEKNDLAQLYEKQRVKIVSVEEFADRIKSVYRRDP